MNGGHRNSGLLVVLLGASALAAAADVRPGDLLIYYAWPSNINGAATINSAIAEFAQYDVAIIGDGLQDGPGDPLPHPDHANTVQIVNAPETAQTRFFGYIDLGVTTDNHALSEIQRRVDAWKAMGIDGIFLDDFGYDYGTTRARQNAAVDYIHSQGLPVCANGWVVDDVFGAGLHVNNPTGMPTSLGAADAYLSESHQIIEDEYATEGQWQGKANDLRAYQQQLGFEVWSITTTLDGAPYVQNKFHYAWYSAALYGHAVTGWGEYIFSADDGLAPYRARPGDPLGQTFKTGVWKALARFARTTERGVMFVNTATHAFGLDALPDGDGDGVGDFYDACADTPVGVVVDVDGRPVGDLNCDCRSDIHDFAIMQLNRQ